MGGGTQSYRTGSWQPGSPSAPGPDARSPAALFRLTLGAINHRLSRRGTAFAKLTGPGQDALLTALQTGSPDFLGIPTPAFFALLLAMTMEGFFSHPCTARGATVSPGASTAVPAPTPSADEGFRRVPGLRGPYGRRGAR